MPEVRDREKGWNFHMKGTVPSSRRGPHDMGLEKVRSQVGHKVQCILFKESIAARPGFGCHA